MHWKKFLILGKKQFKRLEKLGSTQKIPLLVQSLSDILLILVIMLTVIAPLPGVQDFAYGSFLTTTTDADGVAHLASNTVNAINYYDTTKDAAPDQQQQLGVDPNWKNGVVRKSYGLQYNGTNHYVQVADSTSLKPDNAITVEAWFSTTDNTRDQRVVSKTESGDYQISFNENNVCGSSKFCFAVDIGGSYKAATVAASTISNNTWYHVAGQYDGANVKLFINGTLQATTAATGTITHSTAPVCIGSEPPGSGSCTAGSYFGGLIDEVRISNIARYQGNFASPRRYQEDINTVGLWHFDEGSGSTANDSSQYANTGTLTNTPTWVTGANAILDGFVGCSPDGNSAATQNAGSPVVAPGCNVGNRSGAGNISVTSNSSVSNKKAYEVKITGSNALSFDGSNDTVDFGDVSSTESASALTWDFWTNPTSLASTKCLLCKFNSDNTQTGWAIETGTTSSDRILIRIPTSTSDGSTYGESGTGMLGNGVWAHIAIVFNGAGSANSDRLQLFVNGQPQALSFTGTIPASTQATTSNARAGNSSDGARFYNGTIDEARISSSVRYTNTFTPLRRYATDTNTIALWHFDEGSGTSVADSSGNGNTGTLGASTGAPTWVEGIGADPTQGNTSSTNWAFPGYQFRQQFKITNNVASIVNPGYGVETTTNRGTILDNHQSRPDGKDWRVAYQPTNQFSSLSLNGSSTFVKVQANTTFNSLTTFTIELWAKMTSSVSSGAVLLSTDAGNGNNDTFVIQRYNANALLEYCTGDSSSLHCITNSTINPFDNQWHHIAYTYDGTTQKAYIDGVLDGSNTATFTPATPAQPLFFASNQGGGSFFAGQLDEVRISNSVRYTGNFSSSRTPFVTDASTRALWHLDEGSGQVVRDMSGNENNGTLGADTGSAADDPTWVTTDGAVSTSQPIPDAIPHGHALRFTSGSAMGVTMTSASGVGGSSQVTIDTWIKLTSLPSSGNFADVYREESTGAGVGFCRICTYINSSGKLLFSWRLSDGGTRYDLTANTVFSTNTWYHLAAVYDATTSKARIFINGTLDVSSTNQSFGTLSSATSGAIYVGWQSGGTSTNVLNGLIDEVRVSNTNRYKGNFTALTTPYIKDSLTKGLWHFDDGSGTTTVDSSGNGNGTTSGSPTWVTNGGKVDSINETQFKTIAPIAASGTDSNYYLYYGNLNETGSPPSYNSYNLRLDGTNDYVSIANQSNFNFSTASTFSVSAWIKTATSGATQMIFGKADNSGGGTTAGYYFYIRTTNFVGLDLVNSDGTAGRRVTGNTNVTDSKWHHVIGTYDGSNTAAGIKIYVDGVLETLTTVLDTSPGTITNSLSPAIGARSAGAGTPSYFNGSIDDVRVYTRTLAAADVTGLNSNTPFVNNASLQGWWKLDDITAAGTSATDSSGSGNTGTLTNMTFDATTTNWQANATQLHATTEPSLTNPASEQETPIFFAWKQVGGSFSASAQITPTETQLGAEGVYLKFNLEGIYSRQDYYTIPSWAVEAFSSSTPQRGKRRSFPVRAHLVGDASTALTIIDADTNKVWMRFTGGNANLIDTGTIVGISASNGHIFLGTSTALFDVSMMGDNSTRYTVSGTATYGGNIASRSASSSYGAASGTALISSTVSDASAVLVGSSPPKMYVAVSTNPGSNPKGMTLIQNATGTTTALNYSKNTNDSYSHVFLATDGSLYGSNTTAAGLDKYTTVNADSAGQTTSSDVTYSTASSPALMDNTINSISAVTANSIADNNVSNEVVLGNNSGADLIDEHSTQSSAGVRHYVRTGTIGSSNWSSKQFGGALKFDGTNDVVNVVDTASLSITGNFTVEAWIKTTSISTQQGIIEKSSSSSDRDGYGLRLTSSGTVQAYTAGAASVATATSSTVLTANTWYHLAGVYDGSTLSVYINGVRDGTPTSTSLNPTDGATSLKIGSRGDSATSTNFSGLIDEARISSTARYTATFTPSSVALTTDGNTAGLWHLNERSLQTVFDDSSNVNNGTLGASSSVASDDPLQVIPSLGGSVDTGNAAALIKSTDVGQNLNFDGVNDLVKIPDAASLNPSTAITISTWAMTTRVPVLDGNYIYALVIKRGGSPNWPYQLFMQQIGTSGYGVLARAVNDSSQCVYGGTEMHENNWYHIAMTYDGSNLRIYESGILKLSCAITGALPDDNYQVELGGSSINNNFFLGGSMDDTRIYNRALSGAEIAALYNGGAGRTDNPSSGIVGWWKMNEGSGQTVTDSSGSSNNGTLGSSSSIATDDPTWSTGSPVRNRSGVWFGTTSAGSATGALTDTSLETDRQIVSWTSSNSGLPNNDINWLSAGSGGLALVGTRAGAWAPGLAGSPVDDTAASAATLVNAVRIESGTVHIKGGTGTVRIRPGP